MFTELKIGDTGRDAVTSVAMLIVTGDACKTEALLGQASAQLNVSAAPVVPLHDVPGSALIVTVQTRPEHPAPRPQAQDKRRALRFSGGRRDASRIS